MCVSAAAPCSPSQIANITAETVAKYLINNVLPKLYRYRILGSHRKSGSAMGVIRSSQRKAIKRIITGGIAILSALREFVIAVLANLLMLNFNAQSNFPLKKSVPHMVTGDQAMFHHNPLHPLGRRLSLPWLTVPHIQTPSHPT
jgi:hypothetical protein